MILEVREPQIGELWWRQKSETYIWGESYDALHYYSDTIYRDEPFMWRCYSAAVDLKSMTISQFGKIDFGKPIRHEVHELVSGKWFLAAEAGQTTNFLRNQIELYKQDIQKKLDKDVAEMTSVINFGKHPLENVKLQWIA